MRIAPISYSIFQIKENKENREILKSANPIISDVPNFYVPTIINFKGQDSFRKNLEETFKKGDESELFLFFDESLRARAKDKKIAPYLVDDTVQSGILDIIFLMRDFEENSKDENWLFDEIEKIYIDLKPKKEDYVGAPYIESLNKKMGEEEKPLIELLTEKNLIVSLSQKSDEEKEKIKKELQKALAGVDLTLKEQEALDRRFSGDGATPYRKIGKEKGVSEVHIKRILKGALLKIQISNNALDSDTKQFIDDFSREFKIEVKEAENAIIRYPQIISQGIDKTKRKIEDVADRFKDEKLRKEEYIRACVGQPQLFCILPDTVEKNVRDLVERFDDEGLTTKEYLNSCLKQSQLFCQSPDTIEKNVRDLVKKFEDEGLTTKEYLKSCLIESTLFYRSPNTIEKNVRDLVKKFENEGLTTEEYLVACTKRPSLFYYSPDTVEKHVRDLVERFENEGLTTKEYLKSCLKQPQLFYQSPDTIEKNVRDLVKKFENEGLTTEKYLKSCVKCPPLFTLSPDTVGEHIDILKFSRMNSEIDINDDNFFDKILPKHVDLTYSSSLLLIKYLIIPKMFENSKIPKELRGSSLREKLNDYLKTHPKRSFTLNVKPIETNTDCFRILDETIRKIEENAGRENVFEINVQG